MGELRRKMGRWRDFIDGSNDDLRYEQMKPRVYPPGQRPLSDPRWLHTTRGKGFMIFVFVGMSAMVTMPLWPDMDNTSSTDPKLHRVSKAKDRLLRWPSTARTAGVSSRLSFSVHLCGFQC